MKTFEQLKPGDVINEDLWEVVDPKEVLFLRNTLACKTSGLNDFARVFMLTKKALIKAGAVAEDKGREIPPDGTGVHVKMADTTAWEYRESKGKVDSSGYLICYVPGLPVKEECHWPIWQTKRPEAE